MVLIQNFLFYIALYVSCYKASLLKFNMFNMFKNTISKMFLDFSNFKILDLK